MTHLQEELEQLREFIIQSMELVINQISKANEALIVLDSNLAEEILRNEKRLNSYELSIDRDCENILALYNPVATDLRFLVSSLKINADLERIGDHAAAIANYVLSLEEKIDPELTQALKVDEMFQTTVSMISDVKEAFETENTKLARKVFKKDNKLNQINKKASQILEIYFKEDKVNIRYGLYAFSIIRKLERVGDLTTNIAEDIIFYLEARVLKHKKDRESK